MADDQADTVLPLSKAFVSLQRGDETRRFRVHTATLTPRGSHRVRLGFEGAQGSVAIELPRVVFWRLTELFHEQAIGADEAPAKKRKPRKRR